MLDQVSIISRSRLGHGPRHRRGGRILRRGDGRARVPKVGSNAAWLGYGLRCDADNTGRSHLSIRTGPAIEPSYGPARVLQGAERRGGGGFREGGDRQRGKGRWSPGTAPARSCDPFRGIARRSLRQQDRGRLPPDGVMHQAWPRRPPREPRCPARSPTRRGPVDRAQPCGKRGDAGHSPHGRRGRGSVRETRPAPWPYCRRTAPPARPRRGGAGRSRSARADPSAARAASGQSRCRRHPHA